MYNPVLAVYNPWVIHTAPKSQPNAAHFAGRWVFLFAVHAAEKGVKGDEKKKRGEGEGKR